MIVRIFALFDDATWISYQEFINCVFTVDDVETPDRLVALNWSYSLDLEQLKMEK